MATTIFRCPLMGVRVQGWIAEEIAAATAEGEFIGIECNACRQRHFVNPKTGRVLGQDPLTKRED